MPKARRSARRSSKARGSSRAAPGPAPFVGEVKAVERHAETSASLRSPGVQEQILTFLLQRMDDSGVVLETIPIELRGLSISGIIRDGDQVSVSGEWEAGDPVLWVDAVYNLSNESWVIAARPPSILRQLALAFGFLAVFAILAALFFAFVLPQFVDTSSSDLGTATMSISPTSGSSGTTVEASGAGFKSNEPVDVYMSAEVVGSGRADSHGVVQAIPFAVPEFFAAFHGDNISVEIHGKSSILVARTSFHIQ